MSIKAKKYAEIGDRDADYDQTSNHSLHCMGKITLLDAPDGMWLVHPVDLNFVSFRPVERK